MHEKRKITRNPVWPGTKANFVYRKPGSHSFKPATANVINIGSRGMFIETPLWLPSHTELDIQILFQPDRPNGLSVNASGLVVRADNDGLGVQFTNIDLQRLGDCIISMLNASAGSEKTYHLQDGRYIRTLQRTIKTSPSKPITHLKRKPSKK